MYGISCNKKIVSTVTSLLLDDTVLGVEAVLEVFGVLVGGVLDKHLARGGALEGLEARLALDRLGGSVLRGSA